MQYVSTRGGSPPLAFDEVLLAGLARDGGLFVPSEWPRLSRADLGALAGFSYAEIAFRVMRPYVGGRIGDDELAALVEDSYREFGHRAVAPLKQLGPELWLMELFHGPTLAFKDYALQLVGRLFDHVLARRGARVTIVGATSGDTGSAAIEACRDRSSIDIFILHPEGRVSEVQRRQMTTVPSANVYNLAIQGTFDDCQALVKGLFNDLDFRDRFQLSAVNSINWARIMAQIVYYVAAALALGAPRRKVSFTVPTGNFGNVFAAYAARMMGLPIDRLVIASNRNDILTRLLESGSMKVGTVEPSLSPSMDIQVSSNFERLLFELCLRQEAEVVELMEQFRRDGVFELSPGARRRLGRQFTGGRADDAHTLAAITETYRTTGELVDPHTAVGLSVAETVPHDPGVPMVALACAHPAKFPDAVERATGIRPALPARLADLMSRPERLVVLPNRLDEIRAYIAGRVARAGAA